MNKKTKRTKQKAQQYLTSKCTKKLELSKQYGNCIKPHGPLEYNRASGSILTFLHPTDFQQKQY